MTKHPYDFQNPVNKFPSKLPMKILVLCIKLYENPSHKNLPSLEKGDFFLKYYKNILGISI